jgi:thiol-disulfide isomerase/thioredoxin
MAGMKIAAAALAALLSLPALAEDDLPSEGQPAPSFQLRTMNPESAGSDFVSLDRLVGEEPEDPGCRAVLLSFFASWCAPCQKEMPVLEQLHLMYRERGLRVISVNIDREEPGLSEARRQLRAARVTYPVLSDRFNLLARRYLGQKSPLPSVFIIRRDGTIARIERGYGKDASTFLTREVQGALGIARGDAAARK